MRPAPPPRIALAATAALEPALAAIRADIHLRLRAGDEGGQAVDAAGIGDDGLRLVGGLRLILRLCTMIAFAVLARLLVVALIGLLAVALLMITRVVVALAIAVAHEGLLRRLRDETPAPGRRPRNSRRHPRRPRCADGLIAARLLALAELLLGRSDQAEVMLGMLVVVLGCNGVAGGARVTRSWRYFSAMCEAVRES
jgi:hypothetical protein